MIAVNLIMSKSFFAARNPLLRLDFLEEKTNTKNNGEKKLEIF